MLSVIRTFAFVLAVAFGGLSASLPGWAQEGLFAPVITVNTQAITGYELQQRERLLAALNAPGNLAEEAREQLIDDRLRLEAAREAGIRLSDAEILDGMAEFASRANLTREQFLEALAAEGVEANTFRDFVRAGLAWRTLVQARVVGRVSVDDAEVDRALSSQGGGSSVRVLLSEIVMPMTPNNEADVRERAERIAQLTSIDAFAAQAARFSATPSRNQGGRLDWQALDTLPPVLQPLVLALKPGEVTDPLPVEGAIALFQLRAIQEVGYTAPPVGAVEYAALYLPGGRSPETLAQAADIAGRVDRCDDLYGIAKGGPDEALERATLPPADLPAGFAQELAALDPGEVSTALTRSNGQTLVFLMLCGRTAVIDPDLDLAEFTRGLRSQRITAEADGLLAQLRAEARIIEQ